VLLPDSAGRDTHGRLRVGDCDVAGLAAEYGTPLYIFDEQTLRSRLRSFRDAVHAWPAGGDVLYSGKAYLGLAMVRLLIEEDCGLDVVSGGELAVALRAGLDPRRIGFPGNNKTEQEVAAAAEAGIGHLVIDSDHELAMIAARPAVPRLQALLRISPGIRPDTHDFISTGQLDSKFGFSVENGSAMEALRTALTLPTLQLRGVHMHIGSQILDLRSYPAAIQMMATFLQQARRQLGFVADTVSVGGGLGIAYVDDDDPPTVAEFMTTVTSTLQAALQAQDLPLPALIVEPGRSVAGPAGLAVYTVGARKQIPGVRTYVAVDGGMADNIRPKLYGARYQPLPVVDGDGGSARELVTLAGRYCESTDILAKDVELPRLDAGDLVAIPAAGAYTLSMASNYNVSQRPAVVFVAGGIARLVRRRETLDDWLAPEVGPPIPA